MEGNKKLALNFDGQCVQPCIDIGLECIIHKPVCGHPTASLEGGSGQTNAKVGAITEAVGTGVAGMSGAFVNHLQPGRLEPFAQGGFPAGACLGAGTGIADLADTRSDRGGTGRR